MKRLSHSVLPFISLLLFASISIADTKREPDRFFLMGDGRLHIKNMKTGLEASVSLLNPDNSLNWEGFNRIDEVFGFPTEEKGENISPRLLFMLDHFSDLVAPGKVIQMVSAYRSPEYNNALRDGGGNVARTSLHLDGMALDFSIEGVDGRLLWELIRSKDCCGVGHYGGATLHLDSGRPRFWEAATSGTRTAESERNRKIYLSSDFDRYRPGDSIRLSFSSVSDFGFGIRPFASISTDSQNPVQVATAPVAQTHAADCILIPDRKASRFISLTLPDSLPAGRYRLGLTFCQRPFEEMPEAALSNVIEVFEPGP